MGKNNEKDVNEKKTFLMNGYILNLVTCFDNRGLTKHYDTKVRFLLETYLKKEYNLYIFPFLSLFNAIYQYICRHLPV